MESKAFEEAQMFANAANYKGAVVTVKKIRKSRLKLDRDQLRELKRVSNNKHSVTFNRIPRFSLPTINRSEICWATIALTPF